MSIRDTRVLGIIVGLTLCLGYGCAKWDDNDSSAEKKLKPVVVADPSGEKWVWAKTSRCTEGAWFKLVFESTSRVVEYCPPEFLAGLTITAIHEDGTAMLMSNVDASKRSQWQGSGVDGWPPAAPEK